VKKLSVIIPSSVIPSPHIAKQLESERAAEEQRLREQYAAQITTLEKEARAKFEADLAAKRAAAQAQFEAGLAEEKSKAAFEAELASKEAAARSEFESQMTEQRRKLVEAPVRAARREYAMVYGVQMIPRHYRAVKEAAETTFKTLTESEKELMEEQLKTWRAETITAWETEQREKFAEDLSAWEKEAKKSFEAQVSEWKVTQEKALEPQIEEWREAWQAKGLAERMMEIKVPSLGLDVRLAQAMGMKYVISPKHPLLIRPEEALKEAYVRPLAFPAGMIASVESIVYSVGQLAGLKTPRIPLTLSQAVISSGMESVMKGELVSSPEMQQLLRNEPAYAVGTIFGDILVAYGIGKAVQMGGRVIKGAAKFVYEESGLKYSHALYKAKQLSIEISERLPHPITAIKESHLAYRISEGLSEIKHKVMPIKYAKAVSEGIVGLPTVEEGIKLGLKELPTWEAGLDIAAWAEAPRTALFGLTVPKVAEVTPKVISPLGTALAETMWITPTAAEKWAVRAGIIPRPEDVIVEPPKVDVGLKMIKGGRAFSIPEADILGFTKLPKISPARAGEFFFEKQRGRIPTLRDLMKDIKAQATTTQLLETPAKIVEPVLPKLAMLPEAAAKISVSEVIGVGVTLGIKPLGKARLKPEEKASVLAAEILKPIVSPAAAAKAKVRQAPLIKEIAAATQVLRTVQIPQILKPSKRIARLPRKREEPFPKIKRAEVFGKKPKLKMGIWLYPVATESEATRYVLGKTKVRSKRK